ncbi:Hypothetical protein Hmuk_2696 [Halomicrobium mukohataei DSM 12286]|uniref:MTH865 family protein n=2 Tax=Halomicrobium mukohataei TaxID=57705 RepID=C7NZN4_HALMD|nr:Hypothetical protein Hmuk_2696 [Halomicrobium mukohataei DSM 12286]
MWLCGVVECFFRPVDKRDDMADKDDLREQFTEAFEEADYPISSPMDLVPALPSGPSTKFESGDFSMTAMELNTKLGGDFPYDSVDEFVDSVMEQLDDQDLL